MYLPELRTKSKMKKFTVIVLFICSFPEFGFNSEKEDLRSKVQFASIEKAKELLTTEDFFTKNWSQFDIDSRLHKSNSKKEELFKHIASQAREWTNEEKDKINSILETVCKKILKSDFKINFPNEIFFIKTTAKEEGDAEGYTRGDYVVLKEGILSMKNSELEQLIVHEIFHILSRNDTKFRKEMYKIIGFEINNEIRYPDKIKNFRITNPDAPQTDSYIVLKKDGKPIICTMILYSKSEYTSGDFFNYLNVGFLKLKGSDSLEIDYVNDYPVIYTYKEVSDFFEKVGKNTQYIIHPEEILADNFAFAIDHKKGLPSQWIVDKIQSKLKE